MVSWAERFKKASANPTPISSGKEVKSAFGADANPSGLPEIPKTLSMNIGWAALGVIGAIWFGYEVGVRKLTGGR